MKDEVIIITTSFREAKNNHQCDYMQILPGGNNKIIAGK